MIAMLWQIHHQTRTQSGVETVVFFWINESCGDEDLRAKMVRVTYTLRSIVAVAYLVSSAYPARSAQTTNKEYFTAGNSCNISGPE